jgi:hypothetical protein
MHVVHGQLIVERPHGLTDCAGGDRRITAAASDRGHRSLQPLPVQRRRLWQRHEDLWF